MAISKADIIKAANDFDVEGISPTMKMIRKALGSGSFATISPVLREWKIAKEKGIADEMRMSDEAKKALEKFGSEVWRVLHEEAEMKYLRLKGTETGALEDLLHKLESSNNDLLNKENLLKDSQEKIRMLDTNCTQLKFSLANAQDSLAEKKNEIKDLKASLESYCVKNGQLQHKVVSLEKQILDALVSKDTEDTNPKAP